MDTWKVQATVKRIIDGDTFAADLDLGWGIWRKEGPGSPCRIRLLDYDSPEKKEPGHREATQALERVLPLGSVVWIESHSLDSFGRVLATVYTLAGDNLLGFLPAEYRKEYKQ